MFWSVPIADEATIAWLFRAFRWFLQHTGGYPRFRATTLLTPTPAHFPGRIGDPDRLAAEFFRLAQGYAGMADWDCALVPLADDEDESLAELARRHGDTGLLTTRGAAGTFSIERRRAVIRYSRRTAEHPLVLVATLAHELSHYFILALPTPFPADDPDVEAEPLTDVGAIFLGFGIFTANAALVHEGYTRGTMTGWAVRRVGYLRVFEAAYALAIFVALQEGDAAAAAAHLSTDARAYFKAALKDLRRRWQTALAELRALAPAAPPDPAG